MQQISLSLIALIGQLIIWQWQDFYLSMRAIPSYKRNANTEVCLQKQEQTIQINMKTTVKYGTECVCRLLQVKHIIHKLYYNALQYLGKNKSCRISDLCSEKRRKIQSFKKCVLSFASEYIIKFLQKRSDLVSVDSHLIYILSNL